MLGYAFVTGVAPFVYPERLEPAAIDDVRRTKVRLEEYIRQRGKELIEVKRGRGGIRDVEFAVQLLQIVHGRRNPTLRSPNTLAALQALADEGYVAEADANALAEAYRFLRQLEHRLQIVRDLQTHDLPSDPHARTTIARSLGLIDAERLQEEYDRTTGLVRSIHERLFYRPLLEAFAGPAQPRQGVDRTATQELLEGLGFAQPVRSYEVLARLVDPATRLGKVLGHVIPVMTPAIAMAADPDAALVRLERVAEAVGERGGPADALATDPKAAWRLAHLVGAAVSRPTALVADPERIRALADGVVHADDAQADMVRVVAAYAGRELSPVATGAEIAAVADRVLGRRSTTWPGRAARRDRHGQARRAGTQLRERPRRRLRVRGRGRGRAARASGPPSGSCAGCARRAGRSTPTSAPKAATDRSRARSPVPRVLGALRGAVGVPVAAPGARGGRRPGARQAVQLNAAGDLAYPPDGITIDRVPRSAGCASGSNASA